jgi:thioredoxin-related protein
MKLYRIFVALMIIFTFGISGVDLDKLPSYSTTFDKKINPHVSLSKALDKVKKTNKNILLFVGGDWCRWSGTFDNFLDDHPKIAEAFYGSFEVVRVYYGNGINKYGQSLLKQFPPLKGTPHFYILNKKAKLLSSINTVYLERGYGYNKKKVMQFIQKYSKIK